MDATMFPCRSAPETGPPETGIALASLAALHDAFRTGDATARAFRSTSSFRIGVSPRPKLELADSDAFFSQKAPSREGAVAP